MHLHRYVMCDLHRAKVDEIMAFNVASRHERPRSLLEFGAFVVALTAYLGALALST